MINDNINPGNNKYYGTNSIGVKGWYDRQILAATPTINYLSLENSMDYSSLLLLASSTMALLSELENKINEILTA